MHFIVAFSLLIVYYGVSMGLLSALIKATPLDNEWARKTQHIAVALSVIVYYYLFSTWQRATIAALLLIPLANAALYAMERTKLYHYLFVERKTRSEYKTSMILGQLTLVTLFILFWGILPGARITIVIISALAWGLGDAVAALAGKRYGTHKVAIPGADAKKSVEGSLSMFFIIFPFMLLLLLVLTSMVWWFALVSALLTSALGVIVEVISKHGYDTFTLPVSMASLLYGLMHVALWIGGM